MTTPHPDTGRAYVAVIPGQWGPFVDIRACYSQLSCESPWLSVIDPSEFVKELHSLREEDVAFVHWAPSLIDPATIPEDRRALILPVYSEAMDPDPELMLPDHVRDLSRFVETSSCIDGFFAHTPWMVSQISEATGNDGFLLPVGWSTAMGSPQWDRPKEYATVFAGSTVGRRTTILPALCNLLSLDLCTAVYGAALIDRMNASKTALYVAHSEVRSYSTWRIWQAFCSSAALATEPGDWWPMTEELCLPLPRITTATLGEAVNIIRYVSFEDARARTQALREALSGFTTRSCVDHYVVEKTEGLTR